MGNSGYKVNPNILFWIRLKTLQSSNDINRILQIAYIYTDIKLTVCQYGTHFAIQCNQEQLESVDEKELKIFKENGLYEACMNSKIGIQEAQQMIMKDIEFRKIARGQLLAAGKQAHLAKYALMRYMPKLHDFLHYRIFDVSSVQLVIQGFKESNTEEKNKNIGSVWRVINEGRRANEEVWQDIRQMQFYTQHALNDN